MLVSGNEQWQFIRPFSLNWKAIRNRLPLLNLVLLFYLNYFVLRSVVLDQDHLNYFSFHNVVLKQNQQL